jgi:hypothetical protein
MSESESMTYIALEPCGCLVWAQVDDPEHPKRVAQEVGKIIRAGYRPHIIPTEQVRTMDWHCTGYPDCPFGQSQRRRRSKRQSVAQEALL